MDPEENATAGGRKRRPLDDNHALLIGEVMGALHAQLECSHTKGHTIITPEVEDGAYTGRVFIERPSGVYGLVIGRLGRGTLEEYRATWEAE